MNWWQVSIFPSATLLKQGSRRGRWVWGHGKENISEWLCGNIQRHRTMANCGQVDLIMQCYPSASTLWVFPGVAKDLRRRGIEPHAARLSILSNIPQSSMMAADSTTSRRYVPNPSGLAEVGFKGLYDRIFSLRPDCSRHSSNQQAPQEEWQSRRDSGA